MSRRNSSDVRLRGLLRRIAEGDLSLLPVAARVWERSQGDKGLPGKLVEQIVTYFEMLEEVAESTDGPFDILEAFTDADDYPEFDSEEHANLATGFIRGVSEALDLSVQDLWLVSERARSGRGAVIRADRTPLFCDACGETPGQFGDEHEPGCRLAGRRACSFHHDCSQEDDEPDELEADEPEPDDEPDESEEAGE
jgi:hypothetical protein